MSLYDDVEREARHDWLDTRSLERPDVMQLTIDGREVPHELVVAESDPADEDGDGG